MSLTLGSFCLGCLNKTKQPNHHGNNHKTIEKETSSFSILSVCESAIKCILCISRIPRIWFTGMSSLSFFLRGIHIMIYAVYTSIGLIYFISFYFIGIIIIINIGRDLSYIIMHREIDDIMSYNINKCREWWIFFVHW